MPSTLLAALLLLLGPTAAPDQGPAPAPALERRTSAWPDPLPTGAAARLGTTRLRDGHLHALALASDGKTVASVSEVYADANLWDSERGEPTAFWPGQKPDANAAVGVAFTAKDRLLAVATRTSVRLLPVAKDAAAPSPWTVCAGDCDGKPTLEALAAAPGDRLVVTACSPRVEEAVGLYSLAGKRLRSYSDGVEEFRPEDGKSCGLWLAVSPDGRFLAAAAYSEKVVVWNLESGARIPFSARTLGPMAFTPDGKRLLLTHLVPDEGLRIVAYDLAGGGAGAVWRLTDRNEFVKALAVSRDGRLLATTSTRKATLFDVATGRVLSTGPGTYHLSRTALFSGDGRTLIYPTDTPATLGRIATADAKRLAPADLGRHDGSMDSVAFSPDGARLATGSTDGTARVWSARDGAPQAVHEHAPSSGSVAARVFVAWPGDGSRLATVGEDCSLHLVDPTSGKELVRSKPVTGCEMCRGVAVSPDGRRVAAAFYDGTVRVFDGTTAREVKKLVLPAALSGSELRGPPAFSGDGKAVYALAVGGLARFDLATGKAKVVVRLEYSPPRGAEAFALVEQEQLVVLGNGPALELRSLASGKLLGTVPVPVPEGESVHALAPHPRRAALAVGAGRRVDLLELPARKLRAVGEHAEFVSHVAFDPTGARLVSTSFDTTALVWSLEAPEPE